MGNTQFGKWHDFCRDSGSNGATIPVCNLFNESPIKNANVPHGQGGSYGGTALTGIQLTSDTYLKNIGSIIIAFIAMNVGLVLLWRSERKKAAVGRREIQLFLLGYMLISLCTIFTIGGIPFNNSGPSSVVRAFSAIQIGAVPATVWVLMLNGAVGFQVIEDGTAKSIGLVIISALMIFIGTGYIALDTGFGFTQFFNTSELLNQPNQAYALYTLYLLVPLVFLSIFFLLETFLVLRILGEKRPMIYLFAAALLFAIGQIFQFVISVHICNATNGKINGGLFETLFTLFAVIMVWVFWSSITEDDWPAPAGAGGYAGNGGYTGTTAYSGNDGYAPYPQAR